MKCTKESYTYATKEILKDGLGDRRGGSEWEPIKILQERD
jgi:hypothetical protein